MKTGSPLLPLMDGVTFTPLGGRFQDALAMPRGWSGAVEPTNGGWGFTPASLSLVNFNADAMHQNFTANLTEAIALTATASGGVLTTSLPSGPEPNKFFGLRADS